MNLEALIVRTERGAMRKLPPALVFWANAQLHRRLGEPELRELPRLVRPGSIAIDVGGHFGTFSYALARLVGKQGRVLSFEPITEDARLIEAGAKRLRLPITVYPCALSAAEGTAEIHVPYLHGAEKTALASLEPGDADAAGEARRVPVRRLDDVLAEAGVDRPVSFLKIDVEGHELGVLEGARETLDRYRPNILIEINDYPGGRPVQAVFDTILAHGYRGEFLEAGRYRRSLPAFDIEKHQRAAADHVLSKDYVNNFIFLPE